MEKQELSEKMERVQQWLETVVDLFVESHPYCDRDELISECNLKIISRSQDYDPSRGCWENFLSYIIYGYLQNHVRDNRNHYMTKCFSDLSADNDEGVEVDYEAAMVAHDDVVEREGAEVLAQLILKVKALLPAKDWQLLSMTLMSPKPEKLATVAKQWNMTESNVSIRRRNVLERLRKNMEVRQLVELMKK